MFKLHVYETTTLRIPNQCQSLNDDVFLQRREYKSKFLEVETEASRTKDRLEMMNHILDEMQEKM